MFEKFVGRLILTSAVVIVLAGTAAATTVAVSMIKDEIRNDKIQEELYNSMLIKGIKNEEKPAKKRLFGRKNEG